jgi:glyoxalase family protein
MQLAGIHHLTAITADVTRNHAFYTRTLGLRLVKKSVNQDDVSAYHLFYADGAASPGSDITFFDWPVPPERRGSRSIARTGFRVGGGEETLSWWTKRFTDEGVVHQAVVERDGRATLDFEDFEGQRLSLIATGESRGPEHPWAKSPVPAGYQIHGLGPITLSVPNLESTGLILTDVLAMRKVREYRLDGSTAGAASTGTSVHVYEMGEGGPAAELHVAVEPGLAPGRQGAGATHHVAFRTTAKDYAAWTQRLSERGLPSSGPVNRYYFQSLYFREPNGILFEIATDEPGFAVDEPMETLGERLALPPFLEPRRAEIEAGLKPIG